MSEGYFSTPTRRATLAAAAAGVVASAGLNVEQAPAEVSDAQIAAKIKDESTQTRAALDNVVVQPRTFANEQSFSAGVNLIGQASQFRINGHGFTQPYDTDVWVAGKQRLNPKKESQAMYLQHRLKGDMGQLVHVGGASELRLEAIQNATFLNAFEATTAVSGTAGNSQISDARSITANLHWQGTPTGILTNFSLIRAQTVAAPPRGFTVNRVYGLHIEPQTVGTHENWSVYAPLGASLFGDVQVTNDATVGAGSGHRTLRINGAEGALSVLSFQAGGTDRWLLRRDSATEHGGNAGSDLVLIARDDRGGNLGDVIRFHRSSRGIQLGTGPLGFFGATPTGKPTIRGSRSDGTALANLLTALEKMGLIKDDTTA
ncbi:hypothetical protein [Citricoccus sp. K5]|uniref:hypothetical protein n=1 Tax=Citricoccus sp. K5 TaxID=2653135 RepID=UPI0012F1E300|nr:hypothetical protein [Citricoccus sp. K5]VXB66789.1 exported hypothetical protein [Citricoccus sp. K5]